MDRFYKKKIYVRILSTIIKYMTSYPITVQIGPSQCQMSCKVSS